MSNDVESISVMNKKRSTLNVAKDDNFALSSSICLSMYVF